MNSLTDHVADSRIGTMTVSHAEHKECALQIVKDWILKYEQGK